MECFEKREIEKQDCQNIMAVYSTVSTQGSMLLTQTLEHIISELRAKGDGKI